MVLPFGKTVLLFAATLALINNCRTCSVPIFSREWHRRACDVKSALCNYEAAWMPTERNANHLFGPNADRAECRRAECRPQLLDLGRNADSKRKSQRQN